jgi:hypothetical protein
MSGKGLAAGIGVVVTVLVHGALALGYVVYRGNQDLTIHARLGSAATRIHREAPLLCGKLRCPQLEAKQRRRAHEEAPIEAPEILEAAMIPALGAVDPDARRLPEIETYERPQIFEDGVNLESDPPKLDKLIKDLEKKDELKDPKNKNKLRDLLSDEDPDPRARAKDLSRLTGFKEGEIGGQGMELRLGSTYSVKVAREISKVFKTPPFLDDETLKKLQVRVQVSRMSFDGGIEDFRVISKSNDRSFDDAALAAIKQFVPSDGGSRRLPEPEPEVLRFINSKGLTITLDGRLMRR